MPGFCHACTKFGVDGSSQFFFQSADAHAHRHTKSQTPLIALPTHRLPQALVTSEVVSQLGRFSVAPRITASRQFYRRHAVVAQYMIWQRVCVCVCHSLVLCENNC